MHELAAVATSRTTRISSLEIAERTDKMHKDVMRDIRNLIDQEAINERSFALVEYKDGKGEMRPMYLLDFEATMTLVTGYDAKRRNAVIKRWMTLERGEAAPLVKAQDERLFKLVYGMFHAIDYRLAEIERNLGRARSAVQYETGPVKLFVIARCTRDQADLVRKTELHKAYQSFCSNHGLAAYGYAAFCQALRQAYPDLRLGTVRFPGGRHQAPVFCGIALEVVEEAGEEAQA